MVEEDATAARIMISKRTTHTRYMVLAAAAAVFFAAAKRDRRFCARHRVLMDFAREKNHCPSISRLKN
jgi:hypothetical protein